MTSTVRIVGTMSINQGKRDELTALIDAMHKVMREKDPGTLTHDWYIDEAGSECVVHEVYASSEAALAHMANVSEQLGRLFELGTIVSAVVCGDPSPEARAALAGFGAKILPTLKTY
ncbi:MAG: antibiotic biosynthesis monooxygenase [Chloroflexi bacterium]|nr:antibiotic biosynthesis monooxygenase [Chloroflexota bacterium]